MSKSDELLRELIEAIGKRWDGETDRKRSNAISPRMEDAIHKAKIYLGMPSDYTPAD
jgi:hypothetical protein